VTSSSSRPRPTSARAPRWLTAAEMEAWRGYIDTVGPLAAALEADLAAFGLTNGDYEVLAWLSEADDEQMRMCDLAGRLRLSPSGLTRRLDGLVSGGLVERAPSTADRRVMMATLTRKGRRLIEATAPNHVESVRRHLIDLLTPAEIAALASAFTKVRTHLRDEQNDAS
jgi:DNA-binding MarR family transcriptional regulator